MEILSFVLLFAALVAFLWSTKQGPLWLRLLVWIVGASVTGFVLWARQLDIAVLWRLADVPPQPLLMALFRNQEVVVDFLSPFAVFVLIFTTLVAIVTLVALTPGDRLERAIRPFILISIGCLAGGLAALSIVAVGFGGPQKRSVFIGIVERTDVIDGDGFRLGDTALRLAGIDALELHQECRRARRRVPCGEEAATRLAELIGGSVVVCRRPDWLTESMDRPPNETFGRPLVQCDVVSDGELNDVGSLMARSGYAIEFHDIAGRYRKDVDFARTARSGVWEMCTLRPDVWRRRVPRHDFNTRGVLPPESSIGQCESPARVPVVQEN